MGIAQVFEQAQRLGEQLGAFAFFGYILQVFDTCMIELKSQK